MNSSEAEMSSDTRRVAFVLYSLVYLLTILVRREDKLATQRDHNNSLVLEHVRFDTLIQSSLQGSF